MTHVFRLHNVGELAFVPGGVAHVHVAIQGEGVGV